MRSGETFVSPIPAPQLCLKRRTDLMNTESLSASFHNFCDCCSGSFRNCKTQDWKHLWGPCLKMFIYQIVIRQYSNASKLCSVASDESFVSFLYINELYRKKERFLQIGRSFSFLPICAWNVLTFKGNYVKIKNKSYVHMFSRNIIKIF